MATEKNITMKQFNGTDYDTLYPKTVAAQIDDVYSKDETYPKSQLYTQSQLYTKEQIYTKSQLYTKEQILTNATKTLYSLGANAVPDKAFQQIKTLIDNVQSSANSKAKIQTGSYAGTGTFGPSNPCSLKFNFVPKFLYVKSDDSSSAGFFLPYTFTNTFKRYAYQGFKENTAIQSGNCYGKMQGTTLSWYNVDTAGEQFNNSGTYHYIALS